MVEHIHHPEVELMPATPHSITTGAPVMLASVRTGATYRELIGLGFRSTEAASLVAYLAGLPVGAAPWTLVEVNRMLFLRHMYRSRQIPEARPRLELQKAA
jgi:hypothetical protein